MSSINNSSRTRPRIRTRLPITNSNREVKINYKSRSDKQTLHKEGSYSDNKKALLEATNCRLYRRGEYRYLSRAVIPGYKPVEDRYNGGFYNIRDTGDEIYFYHEGQADPIATAFKHFRGRDLDDFIFRCREFTLTRMDSMSDVLSAYSTDILKRPFTSADEALDYCRDNWRKVTHDLCRTAEMYAKLTHYYRSRGEVAVGMAQPLIHGQSMSRDADYEDPHYSIFYYDGAFHVETVDGSRVRISPRTSSSRLFVADAIALVRSYAKIYFRGYENDLASGLKESAEQAMRLGVTHYVPDNLK